MSENGEIYTAGNKFYTPAGTDGMDKFHLWLGIRQKSSHLVFDIVTQFLIRGSPKWIFAFSWKLNLIDNQTNKQICITKAVSK